MFTLSDYAYTLPEELIAQEPLQDRDGSRLLCLDRDTGVVEHRLFRDLADCVSPGDILVINNTEVIPGRLFGRKQTGGKVEVLILDYEGAVAGRSLSGSFVSECLVSASKRIRSGATISFNGEWRAEVIGGEGPTFILRFEGPGAIEDLLAKSGQIPLPPYIRRGEHAGMDDRSTYQTIYATHKGAIAAPTAGLHFTEALFSKLNAKGVRIAPVTLHVGYGTFVPVRVADIRDHVMHVERYHIDMETAESINESKKKGGRVIAVGTTTVRTLEYASDAGGTVHPGSGACDLFIYPGYRFRVVDAIITNFHLPGTTLLMLVSAFAERERILSAYHMAINEKYRFYSYGDAMLIKSFHASPQKGSSHV